MTLAPQISPATEPRGEHHQRQLLHFFGLTTQSSGLSTHGAQLEIFLDSQLELRVFQPTAG